jgi:hypothetical protein
MSLFEEWGFWGEWLAKLTIGSTIYFGFVSLWARIVEGFYRLRFPGFAGRRRFLKRFVEPPMPTFQKPVRTLQEIWRRHAGWGFVPLGYVTILNGLKMVERGEPRWDYLVLAILFPAFHGGLWAQYRMAKRAFAELGIESLNEWPTEPADVV